MRIMGLDIGTKRIGVAVSDESSILAQGRGVVIRTGDDETISRIKTIVEDENVTRIVVGIPVNMDGSMGPRAIDAETFAEKIKDKIGIDVDLWDERLSTREAEDIMIMSDMSRKKRKGVIDKVAAQLILQGYLDSIN